MILAAGAVLLLGTASPSIAQQPGARAEAADVETLDGIMAALYESISGPAGTPRDWDRLRSLLAPGARFIPTGQTPDGATRLRALDVDGYVEAAGPGLVANGFFETEIGRVVERFGPVVHLMSAYESRNAADDPEPFMRGVNSIQLLDGGDRWWIVTIFWANETGDRPIPQRLLGGG
ncbi:MAG: hypothetical protein KJO11_00610 [Gemmatimonadetes bacterium]|nr:hypothetical protein [Gemmatimonadota bacterium]MBT8405329.1 hypothetical protein [Gemmatimonadota bacterium]